MFKQLFACALTLALASVPACKSHTDADTGADNTAKNQRNTTVTPGADNSGTSSDDTKLTQEIRKAVVADDSLSTNAHNCKIVVQQGTVTLVGPVASSAEGERVVQIASRVAGPRHVVNQLEATN